MNALWNLYDSSLENAEASGKIDRKRSRATTVEEFRHFKTGKYNLAK